MMVIIYLRLKTLAQPKQSYPQSNWAPKAILMASYSYYLARLLRDAIDELKRFLNYIQNHKDISYAYYLIGICYYELIVDDEKGLKPT
jgi:outer membrane protein assembly factor BamD